MGSWMCGCCTSMGVPIRRLPMSGCGRLWPALGVMSSGSSMCWWRRPRMQSVWVSSGRRRSCSMAKTHSRQGTSRRLWPAGCSLPQKAEPGRPRWISWWRCCHEASRGTCWGSLPRGGRRRAGARAHGADRLWLRGRLLVQATGPERVPLGLPTRSHELLDRWAEIARGRLKRGGPVGEVSRRSHRSVSRAGEPAGVVGSRLAAGHHTVTRSGLEASRRRVDSGASGRRRKVSVAGTGPRGPRSGDTAVAVL